MILDEGVPEALADRLPGHGVSTVKREGWRGIKNGKLLNLIEGAGFEIFITNDKRMDGEQPLRRRPFATLLLSTNSWPTLQEYTVAIVSAIDQARPGTVRHVFCGNFVPRRFRKNSS